MPTPTKGARLGGSPAHVVDSFAEVDYNDDDYRETEQL